MTKDEAMKAAIVALGYDAPEYSEGDPSDFVSVEFHEEGHSGPGWYAWNTEYPEEGSTLLDEPSPAKEA